MRMRWLGMLAGLGVLLLFPAPGMPQTPVTVTAHHSIAIIGTLPTGILPIRRNRVGLGFISDSSNQINCTVDGVAATTTTGVRLAASGTTGDRHFWDVFAPQGAVSCVAAGASSRLLFYEIVR